MEQTVMEGMEILGGEETGETKKPKAAKSKRRETAGPEDANPRPAGTEDAAPQSAGSEGVAPQSDSPEDPQRARTDLEELESAVESILFASGEPVRLERICLALNLEPPVAERVLRRLKDYYAYERRGIRLLQMEDSWQLCSSPDYADAIRRAFEIRKPAKLTQPALEVLTIFAYYQPTTRAYVDKLRGVDSSYTVSLLLERKLIEPCGRLQVPGRPHLYRTTKQFLRAFHLSSLDDLPPLPEGGERLRPEEQAAILAAEGADGTLLTTEPPEDSGEGRTDTGGETDTSTDTGTAADTPTDAGGKADTSADTGVEKNTDTPENTDSTGEILDSDTELPEGAVTMPDEADAPDGEEADDGEAWDSRETADGEEGGGHDSTVDTGDTGRPDSPAVPDPAADSGDHGEPPADPGPVAGSGPDAAVPAAGEEEASEEEASREAEEAEKAEEGETGS